MSASFEEAGRSLAQWAAFRRLMVVLDDIADADSIEDAARRRVDAWPELEKRAHTRHLVALRNLFVRNFDALILTVALEYEERRAGGEQ